MTTVPVNISQGYDIVIGDGIMSDAGKLLSDLLNRCKVLLVSDNIVFDLYGGTVINSLKSEGFDVSTYVFNHGEGSKNLSTLGAILECAAENLLTRSDIIVALGGGVVGDIAGMAAAVYLRGIRYIQMPTTFLAAVDSSVGGKTAIDLSAGKNLAGAFWQPSLVICDTQTLKTLPRDVYADGVAEALKYGMIWDATLFKTLSRNSAFKAENITAECVKIKGCIVSQDEKDNGIRQILNFGHTIGHAIEKLSGYNISHGMAVGIGMVVITRASEALGLTEPGTTSTLCEGLAQYGLPTSCSYDANDIYNALTGDKKRRGDMITVVLVERIGHAFLHNIEIEWMRTFITLGLKGDD